MSTIKTRWLRDNNGDKVAPKTFVSQIMTSEGINLASKLESMLAEKADADHGHNIADIPNLQTTLNGKASQSDLDSLSNVVDGKADKTALNDYYTKAQIDALELITVDDIDAICGAQIVAASEVMF